MWELIIFVPFKKLKLNKNFDIHSNKNEFDSRIVRFENRLNLFYKFLLILYAFISPIFVFAIAYRYHLK